MVGEGGKAHGCVSGDGVGVRVENAGMCEKRVVTEV